MPVRADRGSIRTVLGSIPSPSSGALDLGPLTLHLYGLTLLVAILAAIWLTGRRWTALGGEWELVTRVAVWGVAFGVIGARIYHDLDLVERGAEPEVAGHLRGLEGRPRRLGRDLPRHASSARSSCGAPARASPLFADAAAPGLLLAQAIGRIGNYWNQELYGKPTEAAVGARRSTRRTGRCSTSTRRRSTRPSSTS